jgi:hypothetical protein
VQGRGYLYLAVFVSMRVREEEYRDDGKVRVGERDREREHRVSEEKMSYRC